MTEFFLYFLILCLWVFYPNVHLYKVSEVRKLLDPLELELKFGSQHMGSRSFRQTTHAVSHLDISPACLNGFLKKIIYFYYFKLPLYACVCMRVCACECKYLHARGIGSLGAGVTGVSRPIWCWELNLVPLEKQ